MIGLSLRKYELADAKLQNVWDQTVGYARSNLIFEDLDDGGESGAERLLAAQRATELRNLMIKD